MNSTPGRGSSASTIAQRRRRCPRRSRAETTTECGSRWRSRAITIGSADVGLVDDDQLGHLVGADLGEHLAHRGDLALGVGVRAVDDVQDQVGVGDLLQRRAERLDELVRQVADEADGVGHRVDPAVGGRRTPRGRVERREQRVLDEHARRR